MGESDNGKIFSTFLNDLETTYDIDFIFNEEKMKALTVVGIVGKERLMRYLEHYLAGFDVFRYSDNVVFLVERSPNERFQLYKENFLLLRNRDSKDGPLSGTIVDGVTEQPLPGAKIFFPKMQRTTSSDAEGVFSIWPVTSHILKVDIDYIGYDPNHYVVGFSRFGNEQEVSVLLFPESRQLESITITASKLDENVKGMVTGVENLSIAAMKSFPAFLGEIDPIRGLSTLPGVSTVGGLASGFNVRGGETGQNLILQDGAPVYNPSHLFGFFSAFNPDMIKNVTLYKGGGPANFGSRIASVLDVSLRNGEGGKHTLSGGIGLISSRLTIEGPIAPGRSSYLIGGRLAYPNWLVRSIENISLKSSTANFHDVTAKIFHTIDDRNFVTLTGYRSNDDFKLATDSVFSWATTNVSVTWDHTFSDDLFHTLKAFNSNYFSEVHSTNPIEGFKYRNSIKNIGIKYDIVRSLNEESRLLAGLESTATLIEPGRLAPDPQSENIISQNMHDQRSLETALYFQWDVELSHRWSLYAGLRYGYFLRLGADKIYSFAGDTFDGRYPSVSDSLTYESAEVIKRFGGFEPRLSVRYLINERASLKVSYYRGYQYLHQISNTTSTTPQDYWVSSGPLLKPQRGDQYTAGVFRNFIDNQYALSLEGFYKETDQAVDYIEGADITLNPYLEGGLLQGRGVAYGVEILFKKNSGRVNGWLAYTHSRSLRKFSGKDSRTVINNGRYYPSAFDQPNHASLVLNYRLGARSFLSANFSYSTGRPITIPISKFSYDVYLSVLNYSDRNQYRISDYHRLDVSFTLKDKPRENKRLKSEWVFSVFNIYGRKNTYSISFDRYGTAHKLSVLGSVFPSVSYNFRF